MALIEVVKGEEYRFKSGSWMDPDGEKPLDPLPSRSKRAQQVARLRQLGEEQMANSVSACGRSGDLLTTTCGLRFRGETLHSGLRYCCDWCDTYLAQRLFIENRVYQKLLKPGTTLHFISISRSYSGDPISKRSIKKFANDVIKALKRWLKPVPGSGLKMHTKFEESSGLLIEGIIAIPPGESLPENDPEIDYDFSIETGQPYFMYESLLKRILLPNCSHVTGSYRAHLMLAFRDGCHLRSFGMLYGRLKMAKRLKKKEIDESNASSHARLCSIAKSYCITQPSPDENSCQDATKPHGCGDHTHRTPHHSAGMETGDCQLGNSTWESKFNTAAPLREPGSDEDLDSRTPVDFPDPQPARESGKLDCCPIHGPECVITRTVVPMSELWGLPEFPGLKRGERWKMR